MVNRINKPPPSADLGERLANSNRNLQQMQEEHRQLLLEMEQLRQQAAELSSLSERRITESVAIRTESSNEEVVEQSTMVQNTASSVVDVQSDLQKNDDIPSSSSNSLKTTEDNNVVLKNDDEVKISSDSSSVQQLPVKEEPKVSAESTETNDNAEEADYIKDKLAEIASLKAQFKRVQNIINTTDLIEQHLAFRPSNDGDDVPVQRVITNNVETPTSSSVPTSEPTQTESNIHDENRELLGTMLTMFNDFTSDLRGQADSLRAERERIKQLKEEIISHKRQQNK
ncbi:type III intermediate filament [Teleopsis dalmanni]|uniref:type III intermediate filament n=1 Tax=Teleopsis dalmanni TaxID=139649 RepID=UPI0018CE532A|nr:type III intermediate filament [Teleopsis dalmanni]XP_037934014.1 type III intermediate filament [Teleopsis dalmanni]